jgi:hypothetical protein
MKTCPHVSTVHLAAHCWICGQVLSELFLRLLDGLLVLLELIINKSGRQFTENQRADSA